MASFIARTIAPGKEDRDFIHYSADGNNFCIKIEDGSCLPNCVGYCWGRWLELMGKNHSLPRCNAEDWYNYPDGYKRGSKPKKGAVICWKKGRLWNEDDGAGHVAIVEKVKSNGDIVTSESVYGGQRWRRCTYTKKSGYYLAEGYELQGFIYYPYDFKLEKKSYPAGRYTVKAPTLAVRTGAGRLYRKKKNRELSQDAREQIKRLSGSSFDGYVKGVGVTVYKTKGRWGKTPSGWISLDHCKRDE